MSRATSVFVRLERRLAVTATSDLVIRWKCGLELVKAKAGRKKLPDGYIDDRIAELAADGITVSRRELQYRIKLAETYTSKAQLRKIICAMGSWSEIIAAGFPAVEIDEPDEVEDEGLSTAAPDEWEQLSLIPGLGETLKVGGRHIPLEEATIADVASYEQVYANIHANFEKRLAQIRRALQLMREGADGDDTANALDAWKRGITT